MQSHKIIVGSIWEGRGLTIRILRVGFGIVLVKRLDLSPNLSDTYKIHPWKLESMKGMVQVG